MKAKDVKVMTSEEYEALVWHTRPRDAGQAVHREFAVNEDNLYCRETQPDKTVTLEVAEVEQGEDVTAFEPWNGLVPECGDWETCYVAPFTVDCRDECGSSELLGEYDDVPDSDECESETEDWCRGGDWGSDGAAVDVYWSVSDALGQEVEDTDGYATVMVEADHGSLVKAAGGDTACDHDWTSEGEGGCTENPGVWSTGGTAMVFHTHCRTCGLKRVERTTGSQRNPGEHDTVSYEQPESWCADCQSEECECE